MRTLHRIALCLAALTAVLGTPHSLHAHTGHTSWGLWSFDWEVKDDAGIALRNVSYAGHFFIWKASLPVIRVRYADDVCGPYADRINWDNLLNISNCGDQKVCQRSFVADDGKEWLELGVLAGIGSYRIYQVWYLSFDGWIDARLWSRGLQCDVDHNHHPYWRLDLDVRGAPGDQVFVWDSDRGDEGWGPGWHKYTQELNALKNPPTSRIWFVRDDSTGNGVWIYPGPDGVADDFSTKDVAPRLYHWLEDEPWPFGAWGHLGYLDGEDIQERDVVVWYVAHLHHEAAGGGDEWHWVGPYLKIDP